MINLNDFREGTNTSKIFGKLRAHVMMKTEIFSTDETNELSINPFPSVAFMQSVNCQLLINNDVCYACKNKVSHIFKRVLKASRTCKIESSNFQNRSPREYNPKGMRYHPIIIGFCLSFASKSKSAYEELRNSTILVLPSSRTLRGLQKCYCTAS